MRFFRCKCGERSAWSSMGTFPCDRCPACGSDLAEGPNGHHEPEPHDFSAVETVETDNGPQALTRCRFCHRTRAEIERDEAPVPGPSR